MKVSKGIKNIARKTCGKVVICATRVVGAVKARMILAIVKVNNIT
jgi:tRNA splicing endonuclease